MIVGIEVERIFAAALFAGLSCAGVANAATVTGVYFGELTDSSDPAFPYLAVGDTYRIEFSYNTSVPDADPEVWRGEYDGAVSGNVVFSNGYHLSFSDGFVFVGNDAPAGDSDYFNFGHQAVVSSNFPTGLYALNGIGVSFIDFTRNALSSDQLPTSYLSPALFPGRAEFSIGFTGRGRLGVGLTGTLTAAPIPAALPLFAAALGSLGLFSWCRHRSAAA